MKNAIKMFVSIIAGGILSYFTIKVASHYLAKSGAFDLSKPAEFIIVFATIIFYTLFSYKTCNEFEELIVEEVPAKPKSKTKYFTYDAENYIHYEEIKKDK